MYSYGVMVFALHNHVRSSNPGTRKLIRIEFADYLTESLIIAVTSRSPGCIQGVTRYRHSKPIFHVQLFGKSQRNGIHDTEPLALANISKHWIPVSSRAVSPGATA